MTTRRRLLSVSLDVALWIGAAFVLLGPNAPLRRQWDAWREGARFRRTVRTDWSQLMGNSSRIDAARSADSVHVLIEFGDFQCPFCKTAVDSVDLFMRRHPGAQVIFHHFPLPMHPAAEGAARAALCAKEQGRFKEFYFWLYSHDEWKTDQDWLAASRIVGIPDAQSFSDCLRRQATSERVKEDIALGTELGVSATPTFVSLRGHSSLYTLPTLEKLAGY